MAISGCAATSERAAEARRHGSIKDDPVDTHALPRRAVVASPVPVKNTRPSAKPAAQVEKTPIVVETVPVREPAPRLPTADNRPQPVTVRVDQATKVPVTSDVPLATKTDTKVATVEPPKAAVLIDPPQPRPQPSKPAEVIAPASTETRPTSEPRRKAPEIAVQQAPIALPVAPPAVPALVAPPAKPTQPTPSAPLAPVAPPAVVITPGSAAQAAAALAPVAQPKIVPMTDEQRVATTLQRVDVYMKANRYQEARTVLEDAVKTGNPRLLTALAETYDPLYLRESHPKLARTGDPEKALDYYEQARKAGARGIDARITTLKTMAGPKR